MFPYRSAGEARLPEHAVRPGNRAALFGYHGDRDRLGRACLRLKVAAGRRQPREHPGDKKRGKAETAPQQPPLRHELNVLGRV